MYEEIRNVYKILLGKPEEKRPRHQWEDNIKMDLEEVISRAWIGLI
jgi:hypothetical protein